MSERKTSTEHGIAAAGITVDLFLIAPEEDTNLQTFAGQNYQSVTPVPRVADLAEKGLKRLTERIREAYRV